MNVEVLYTPDCPNAARIIQWLRIEAEQRRDLDVVTTLVNYSEPTPHAFVGSPTVIIDSTNPFGGTHTTSAACALHPPTVSEIRSRLILSN